jgi:signal transduction histidine kinase
MDGERSNADRRHDQESAESQLRSIVERLADGIVIVDEVGVIRFVNPAAEQLFGRSSNQLVGTPLGFPVVVGESTEVEVVHAHSGAITTELRVVDLEWGGEPARLLSLRDITDRKRATERARQLEREREARIQAEAASRAKSEFLAMMSHELRTPLNAVIGYAELLDLGIAGSLTSEQHSQLARIRASGRHLLGLVNEVLDLAKIEAGRLSVNVGLARAGDVADAALSLVQPRADEKGIEFVGQCTGDPAAVFEGDEDRVRQILVNLLSNAVKFTEPGGRVVLECGTAERPEDDARVMHRHPKWVYLRVRDTGIGIPDEQLPLIFDPFVQGESGHTRTNEGSGLGLTISRRLARLMGGDVTVRSRSGEGSVFTLWLPAATEHAADARTPWQPKAEESPRLQGLAEVGELLLREVEATIAALVVRIREAVPAAKSLKFSQLSDHYPSYVADLAGMLIAIEESAGHPSGLLGDGGDIQRLVAERHGAQRARLGWSAEHVRSEYALLRDQLAGVIHRRARAIPDAAIDEALIILGRLLEQGVEASIRGFWRARAVARDETLARASIVGSGAVDADADVRSHG